MITVKQLAIVAERMPWDKPGDMDLAQARIEFRQTVTPEQVSALIAAAEMAYHLLAVDCPMGEVTCRLRNALHSVGGAT